MIRPSGQAAALLAVLCLARPAGAQEPVAIAIGSCESLSPREVRISLTLHNCGTAFARDYMPFVHFDHTRSGEWLYMDPSPGLRPLAIPAKTSEWGPNEVTTLDFGVVTLPPLLGQPVYVKAGLYDAAANGPRLPLVGADATGRVLIGRLVPDGDGWQFIREVPADRAEERIGVRPRAMVRPMPEEPAVRFGEAGAGEWRVEPFEGGAAELSRAREELCWSEASMEVTFHGAGASSGFILRPAAPLEVPESAAAVHLWLLGRAIGWLDRPDPEMPLLWHALELVDGNGTPRQLRFRQRVAYPYWYVARARIPADWPRPLRCTGLLFGGCTNTSPRSFLLDALVFAEERLAPTLDVPADLGGLPLPTSPDGILPDRPAAAHSNRIERDGSAWLLVYDGADERITYRYEPRGGTFDDITATYARPGEEAGEPMLPAAEGGVLLEGPRGVTTPSDPGIVRELVSVEETDDAVRANWRCLVGAGQVEYALRLRISGKSLIVEVEGDSDRLAGIDGGYFRGPADARWVSFPYYAWNASPYGRDGRVIVTDRAFLSGFPDWYRSRASAVTFAAQPRTRIEALTDGTLVYTPGVRYDRLPNGDRAPLTERYVFTVSSDVREVLPNIPNPPSPNRDRLAPLCHSTGGQASRLEEQREQWRRYAAYGVTDVYIRHFDGMWSDVPQGPQEWTLTEHAAPIVGDAAMKAYLDDLRAWGFTPALYTNYTDIQPVAEEFSWDRIAWRPDGDISDDCWPGSYPIKPLVAAELEARFAPRIAARFGTTASFCDVHTAVPPWGKVDYDPRLPGAGEFGTTYRSYGKLLLNDRRTYGAVYSEGSTHWLYAGLADGSDAQIPGPKPYREPFLVDFDLLKMHPLEMDAGMSWVSRYIKSAEDVAALGGPEAALDRFTAATIAFGHQGTFTGHRFRGYDADLRTYHLLHPLQSRYAMRRVEEIRYHDPERDTMLDTSGALRSGAYRHSQVHVRYEGGVEVWVNGSFDREWTVTIGGATYRLPPSGFVAQAPGDVLVYSALTESGQRVDLSHDGDVWFVDARGAGARLGPVETDGAAILRRTSDTSWSVWPLGDMSALSVDTAQLGTAASTVIAFDPEGNAVGDVDARVDGGLLRFPGGPAFRYEVGAQ